MSSSSELYSALHTPTTFSGGDFENALAELRLHRLADEAVLDHLPDPILDIGSGFEELALGVQAIAWKVGVSRRVVSLNPQLIEWFYLGNEQLTKNRVIKDEIADSHHPYADEYLRSKRLAAAGLVEQLPFGSGSFGTVVSLWTYPECWFEKYRMRREDHVRPLREINRVLKVGGTALLGPSLNPQYRVGFLNILDSIDFGAHPFETRSIPDDGSRGSFFAQHELIRLKKT